MNNDHKDLDKKPQLSDTTTIKAVSGQGERPRVSLENFSATVPKSSSSNAGDLSLSALNTSPKAHEHLKPNEPPVINEPSVIDKSTAPLNPVDQIPSFLRTDTSSERPPENPEGDISLEDMVQSIMANPSSEHSAEDISSQNPFSSSTVSQESPLETAAEMPLETPLENPVNQVNDLSPVMGSTSNTLVTKSDSLLNPGQETSEPLLNKPSQPSLMSHLTNASAGANDAVSMNNNLFRPENSGDSFDAFDQELNSPESYSNRRFSFFTLSAGVAVLGSLLGLLGIYLLDNTPTDPYFAQGNAPVIRPAEESKIKPADPGGMEIKNKDVSIYDTLDRKQEQQSINVVEKETPISPKPLIQSEKSLSSENKQPVVKSVQSTPRQNHTTPTTVLPEVKDISPKTQSTAPPLSGNTSPSQSASSILQSDASQSKENVIGQKNTYAVGRYVLQIASVDNEKQANAQWQTAQENAQGLLSDRELRIEKVTIKGRDFYRVIALSFPNMEKAKSLCTSLKQRNVDCLVRKIK